MLKNSPRKPKETQPRHLPSFSTPLNWGLSLTSFDAAQLCLSGTTSIDEGESKGDGQVTLNNLVVVLGRLFSSVQIMCVATNSRYLKHTGNIISPLINAMQPWWYVNFVLCFIHSPLQDLYLWFKIWLTLEWSLKVEPTRAAGSESCEWINHDPIKHSTKTERIWKNQAKVKHQVELK